MWRGKSKRYEKAGKGEKPQWKTLEPHDVAAALRVRGINWIQLRKGYQIEKNGVTSRKIEE